MADYNANIRVNADTSAAERAIKRLSTEVEKLQGISKGVAGVRNIGEAFVPQRNLRQLEGALKTIADRTNTVEKAFARTVEGIGTLAATGAALEGLNSVLKNAATYTGSVAANFSGAAREAGAFARQSGGLEGTLARINDGLVEVAHQVQRAVVPGFSVLDDAAQSSASGVNAAQTALQRLLDSTEGLRNFVETFGSLESAAAPATAALAALAAVMEGQLSNTLYDIEQGSSSALQQLGRDAAAGVSELQRLIRAGQGTVTQYENLERLGRERLSTHRADSLEGQKAANTIARAQKLLNEELERQNDLLRAARGLRSQSVENRATNTYNTTQRRKTFEQQQAEDLNTVNAALAKLESRSGNWADAFGIDAADVAAQRAKELQDAWERLEQEAVRLAAQAPQAAAALEAFKFETLSANADAYTRALRNQQATLDAYTNTAAEAATAIRELGYGGSVPALRPAGFTNQDVRITNLLADQQQSARIAAELQLELDKIVTNAEIENISRALNAEIDAIEAAAATRRKTDDAWWSQHEKRLRSKPDVLGGDAQRRQNMQMENLALGVGFPLLFGGGAGTTLGSFAGSFVGSGFGGQILGGAIGQILDQFVQSTNALGKALLSPTNALDVLRERALLSSREIEKTAEKLQEAGFAASASALAQQDFINSVGGPAVQDLQAAGVAGDRLTRAFAQLGVQMQALAAGPIAALQNRMADLIGNQALMQRGSALSAQLIKSGNWKQADKLDKELLRISTSPNNALGLNPAAVKKELEAAIAEASRGLPPVPIKLDPKQVREELTNALTKQLESIDIVRGLRNQVVAQQRAQEDADRQRYELITSSERTIADLRRSIEDRITQQRLSNLQRENELLNVQADIRLQALRNSNIPLRNQFTNDRVSTAANAIADYLEQEQQIQNQIDQQKRDTALEIQRLAIETEQYRVQVALQVARLNEDNAKRIAEINRGIRRANADQDTRRFNIEKQLADLKLKGLQAEFALLSQQAGAFQNPQIQQAAAQGFNALKTQREELTKLQAPGGLREVGGAPQFGASTTGLDATNARAAQLLGNIQAARTALLDLVRQGNFDALEVQLDNAFDKPLQKAAADAQNVWDTLLGKGLGAQTTEAAGRVAVIDDFTNQLRQLQAETKNSRVKELLQGYIDSAPGLAVVADELRVTTDILGDLNSRYIELQDRLQALSNPYGDLTQVQQVRNQLLREGIPLESSYAQEVLRQAGAVDALQEQVRVATQLQDVWRGVGNAMGEAMTSGVASIVNGTQSAQQVFASFLQTVAQTLLQSASQMIATYIAIGLARAFAFGGGTPKSPTAEGGDLWGAVGRAIGPARAAGGPVLPGVPYLVGENGPELFVPGRTGNVVRADQTQALMASRGALGSGGSSGSTPFDANRDALSTTASLSRERYVERVLSSGAGSSEIKYSRVGSGDLPFVTEADMLQATRLAAQEGARMGQQRTLAALKNNPASRRTIGI